MTEEQKQAMINHAKSWIADAEAMRDEIPFGFDGDTEKELSLIKIALAALTAPPVACKKRLVNHRSGVAHHWTYHGEVDRPSSGDIFRVEVVPLYEHPAPAADLADLVPDEITHADAPELQEIASSARAIGIKGAYAGFAVGANWMRAAILRKIEEAK